MYRYLKMMKMEQRSMSKFNILNRWLEACQDHALHVPPKAITLLQSVIEDADITVKPRRDVWEEYLTIKGGDFTKWYATLSPSEQARLEQRKKEELRKAAETQKHLLRG